MYYVYILANQANTVLYVGVTNDLLRRVREHREKLIPGFTRRYNVDKLVYWEAHESITAAIEREKQIKAGSRARKNALIDSLNPDWRDLYPELTAED